MQFNGNSTYDLANDSSSSRGPTRYNFNVASAELPSEIIIGLTYPRHFDAKNGFSLRSDF